MYSTIKGYVYGQAKDETPEDPIKTLKTEVSSLTASIKIKENEIKSLRHEIAEQKSTIESYTKELGYVKPKLEQLLVAQPKTVVKTKYVTDPVLYDRNCKLTMRVVKLSKDLHDLRTKNDNLESELEELKSVNASLKTQINVYVEELSAVSKQADSKQKTAILFMQNKINELNNKVNHLRHENTALKDRAIRAEGKLEVAQANNQRLAQEVELYRENNEPADDINEGCLMWLYNAMFKRTVEEEPELPLMAPQGALPTPKTIKLN